MTGLLAKAGALFVAPAREAAFAPPRARPELVGVLAPEGDLLVAAGAQAAALRGNRSRPALICAWRGREDAAAAVPCPAVPAAARLAAKIARRGLPARAAGAVAVLELPGAPGEAAAAARAATAATDGAVVLAVARRDPELDALLSSADRLVLALADDADPTLAQLAAGDLAQVGPPVTEARVPRGLVARQAARLGLAAAEPVAEAA